MSGVILGHVLAETEEKMELTALRVSVSEPGTHSITMEGRSAYSGTVKCDSACFCGLE